MSNLKVLCPLCGGKGEITPHEGLNIQFYPTFLLPCATVRTARKKMVITADIYIPDQKDLGKGDLDTNNPD